MFVSAIHDNHDVHHADKNTKVVNNFLRPGKIVSYNTPPHPNKPVLNLRAQVNLVHLA